MKIEQSNGKNIRLEMELNEMVALNAILYSSGKNTKCIADFDNLVQIAVEYDKFLYDCIQEQQQEELDAIENKEYFLGSEL